MTDLDTPQSKSPRHALLTGFFAALLASSCCLGPLVLVSVGISGAWISHLTLLEPYRLWFVVISTVALFFAYRSIWRAPVACAPDKPCATPLGLRINKVFFVVAALILVLALGFPYIAHWFY